MLRWFILIIFFHNISPWFLLTSKNHKFGVELGWTNMCKTTWCEMVESLAYIVKSIYHKNHCWLCIEVVQFVVFRHKAFRTNGDQTYFAWLPMQIESLRELQSLCQIKNSKLYPWFLFFFFKKPIYGSYSDIVTSSAVINVRMSHVNR